MISSIDQTVTQRTASKHLFLERPAHPEQARALRHAVQDYLADLGWPDETVYDITLAVGEAVNNAVCYGEERRNAMVSLGCRLIGTDCLQIEVRNRGIFTPDIDTLSMLPDGLAVHGRGFALMSTLMDAVQVLSEGQDTVVLLSKHLPA